MEEQKKKNFKNKLWYGSKLSQYKLEKVLRCFADNVPAKTAHEQTGVSVSTIRNCYSKFRIAMTYASVTYPGLMNGAGILMMFGYPPNRKQFLSVMNKRRQGKSKKMDGYMEETALRWYASFDFNNSQLTVFNAISILVMAKFHNVLISDREEIVRFLEIAPDNPEHVMSLMEFKDSDFLQMTTRDYVHKLWEKTYREEFEVPKFIWLMILKLKGCNPANETIYRDLRNYLLKHPINGKRGGMVKNNSLKDMQYIPPNDELSKTTIEMFSILKPYINTGK